MRLGNVSPSIPGGRVRATAATADNGKVRMGNVSPASRPRVRPTPQTADNGKVRMGNREPGLPGRPLPADAATADSGKVRMGNVSPSFPARVRAMPQPPTAARSASAA